jgi:hypothetical protein
MTNTKLPRRDKVLIGGNPVKDSEFRYATVGVPGLDFKIASNKKYGDNLAVQRECVCYKGMWWGKGWRRAVASF